VLRGGNKANIADHKLDFRIADLDLFRDLLGRIRGDTVLERGVVQESLSRFISSKLKNSFFVRPDTQVVKQRQQEACMDKQGTSDLTQTGFVTQVRLPRMNIETL